MADEKIRIDLEAVDHASAKIDDVADEAERLERLNPEVEVKADTRTATRDLERTADAVDELDGRDVEITLEARVDDLRSQLKKAEADLEAVKDKAHETEKAVEDVGHGGGVAANAISDLTGPLGEASSMASDFGGALEGAGDIAGGLAKKLGASTAQAESLAAAISGPIAIGAAAVAAAWGLWQQRQAKAKEEAKATAEAVADIQENLRAGEIAKAADKMVEKFSDIATAAEDAGFSSIDAFGAIASGGGEIPGVADKIAALNLELSNNKKLTVDQQGALVQQRDALEDLQSGVSGAADAWRDTGAATAETTRLTADATTALGIVGGTAVDTAEATQQLEDAYRGMSDAFSKDSSLLSAQDALDGVESAMWDALAATKEYGAGSEEASDANRALQRQLLGAKQDVLGYAQAVGDIPSETLTKINAAIDRGDVAEAERLLNTAAKDRTATIYTTLKVPPGWRPDQWRNYLQDINNAGGRAAAPAAASTVNITMNVPRGTGTRGLVDEVANFARRNGGRVVP